MMKIIRTSEEIEQMMFAMNPHRNVLPGSKKKQETYWKGFEEFKKVKWQVVRT
jgi:hypothetical protein